MKRFSTVFSQSSLVPLAKIANAPSKPLRLLWAVVTAIMCIGLFVCIILVVTQYLKHQTVFQLDYSGRHIVYDQVPGITICPDSLEAKRLFKEALIRLGIQPESAPLPWFSKSVMNQFRKKAIGFEPNLEFGAIVHRLPKGQLIWNTTHVAVSPIYGMLLNFSVEFEIQPIQLRDSYRLTVMEQLPNIRNFLCATFELRSHDLEKSWSYLKIRISQERPSNTPDFKSTSTTSPTSTSANGVTFTVITHERGELPFSAYDRHVHTILPPDEAVSLYFSKSVTTRLNTARNPCHVGPDAKFIASDFITDNTDTDYNKLSDKIIGDLKNTTAAVTPITDTVRINVDNSYLDYLDIVRMKEKSTKPTNHNQPSSTHLNHLNYLSNKHSKHETISLFGTQFLYSREACGWAECCAKVAFNCHCTCTLDLLSDNRTESRSDFRCESTQCQDEQIPYEKCPLPCIQTKFIKHSEVRTAVDSDPLRSYSSLKLVRSESVQIATEEEIFSLAKLFSEVGGLCSLFIGFSCIFIFELLEAAILIHYPQEQTKPTNELTQVNFNLKSVQLIPTNKVDISDNNNNNNNTRKVVESIEDNTMSMKNSSNTNTDYLTGNTIQFSRRWENSSKDMKPTMYILPINMKSLPVCDTLKDQIKIRQIQTNSNQIDTENDIICTKQELLELFRQNRVKIRVF